MLGVKGNRSGFGLRHPLIARPPNPKRQRGVVARRLRSGFGSRARWTLGLVRRGVVDEEEAAAVEAEQAETHIGGAPATLA